jgi:tRNA pseudouridine(55) synthase
MKIIEKKCGYTINQLMESFKEENQIKKACFCGRLDPMARGKVLVLINEECKLMNTFLNMNKIYQFEICFGFQTDTDDFLGIIENSNDYDFCNKSKLIDELNSIKNYEFFQQFHKYSSKRVNGKTIRSQILSEIPKHKVKILDCKVLDSNKYNFNNFIDNIIKNINTIDKSKDFRQEEIIKQWLNIKIKNEIDLINSIKIQIEVSSGFYVRQFVRDLSNKYKYPFITFDINRLSIYR